MKVIKRNKLWKGNVELRDYEVEEAIKYNGAKVLVDNEYIFLSVDDLKRGEHTGTICKADWKTSGGKYTYELIGFPFNPKQKQISLL